MLVATLLLAAADEAPLIDVDGTVFVQWALFLIMMAICARLLFKPYLKLRDERKKSTEGAREDASSMQARAREMFANYEAQLQQALLRGAAERQTLRSEGAGRERELLGAARDEAQKAIEAARLRTSTEAGMARKQLEQQSAALTTQIVRKILGREVA